MCGQRDWRHHINSSILEDSCLHAEAKCGDSSPDCYVDYINDAFDERLFKFCRNDMNLMITPNDSASWSLVNGIDYFKLSNYWCIAYCMSFTEE